MKRLSRENEINLLILTIAGAVAVALANGANDNGKGVATLIGTRVLGRRTAMWLGHAATFAGAILSIVVARGLLRAFQGYGLLPNEAAGQAGVLAVVAMAAAATVALATVFRIPISTTHALTGALVGTGLGAFGEISWSGLLAKFVIPLLFSPVAAAVLAGFGYLVLRRLRSAMNIHEDTCLCIGEGEVELAPAGEPCPVHGLAQQSVAGGVASPAAGGGVIGFHVGTSDECATGVSKRYFGVSAPALLDGVHIASAGLISAARSMNDTPKLAALAVGVAAWATATPTIAAVAVCMFLGGWWAARRVTHTMSEKITIMNAGSGATANVVAAGLVFAATMVALPVSTTHVTCGALFGIGVAQGSPRWRAIGGILLAWVVTLPLAAFLAVILARIVL